MVKAVLRCKYISNETWISKSDKCKHKRIS